jgi:hypothetical protein
MQRWPHALAFVALAFLFPSLKSVLAAASLLCDSKQPLLEIMDFRMLTV